MHILIGGQHFIDVRKMIWHAGIQQCISVRIGKLRGGKVVSCQSLEKSRDELRIRARQVTPNRAPAI